MGSPISQTRPDLPAAEADLLGDAVPFEPPAAPKLATGNFEPDEKNEPMPGSAEDENQPGFIGKRNLPHP